MALQNNSLYNLIVLVEESQSTSITKVTYRASKRALLRKITSL